MAYADFSADRAFATPQGAARPAFRSTEQASLSALEWSVVALAKRDSVASLAQPGRLSVALGAVFWGRRPSPQLADPRLEALRRIAVLTWRRGAPVPADEVKAFLDAGFSSGQYETLLASISADHALQGWRA